MATTTQTTEYAIALIAPLELALQIGKLVADSKGKIRDFQFTPIDAPRRTRRTKAQMRDSTPS